METVGTRTKNVQIVAGVVLAAVGLLLGMNGAGTLVPVALMAIGAALVLLALSRR